MAPSSPCAWAARCVPSSACASARGLVGRGVHGKQDIALTNAHHIRRSGTAQPEVQQLGGEARILTSACALPLCPLQDAASEEDCTPDGRLPAAAAPFPAGEGEPWV